MGGTYQFIRKDEFDEIMEKHGYSVDTSLSGRDNTKEYVYSKPLGKRVKLVCYSSVDQRDDEGRDRGKDAIRLVALYVDPDTGDTYPINRDTRTYRVTTWRKNLEKKLEALDETPPRPYFCPKCEKVMRINKRRADGHLFLGCSDYPRCRHTQNLDGDEEEDTTPSPSLGPVPDLDSEDAEVQICKGCPHRSGKSGKYCAEQKTHLWAAVKSCSKSASTPTPTPPEPVHSIPTPTPTPTPTPPIPSTPSTLPVPEGCPDQCKECEHRSGKTGKYCGHLRTHIWNGVKDPGCPNASSTSRPRSITCDECGTSLRGPGYERRDSSGIPGTVCRRCSYLSDYELSFA